MIAMRIAIFANKTAVQLNIYIYKLKYVYIQNICNCRYIKFKKKIFCN